MNFLNSSLRLGRFLGITVRIHILFFIWVGYSLLSSHNWQQQLEMSLMLFGIILVHEYGHCLGARSVGGFAEDILMWPLGGLAFAHAPMRPWPQFVTVACGPLVNVIFCLLSAAILIGSTHSFSIVPLNPLHPVVHLPLNWTPWQDFVLDFYLVNLFILCFNLLPVYPMDGGQLFFTIIWPFVGIQRATTIAAQVGLVGAVLFGLYGLSSGNMMLVMIALFGGQTCWQRLIMAKHGMIMDERIGTYDHVRRQRGDGPVTPWWRRLFGRARRSGGGAAANPNPGGWEAKLTREDHLEAELDRILKKVHEEGINSLSYVERQTLERATRARREREQEV